MAPSRPPAPTRSPSSSPTTRPRTRPRPSYKNWRPSSRWPPPRASCPSRCWGPPRCGRPPSAPSTTRPSPPNIGKTWVCELWLFSVSSSTYSLQFFQVLSPGRGDPRHSGTSHGRLLHDSPVADEPAGSTGRGDR